MFKAPRAQEEEFSAVIASFMEAIVKEGGKPSRTHPVRTAAMQLSVFLLDDPSVPISLTPILRATTADIDRFLVSQRPEMRRSHRSSLRRLFAFLVETGRVEKNFVEDAGYWPGVKRPRTNSEVSDVEWGKIVDFFVSFTHSKKPRNALGSVIFLLLRRNLELTIPEIGSVTMGMARSGLIRLEGRRGTTASTIAIDAETAGFIAKYLEALPTTFGDEEALLRSPRGSGPGNMAVFALGIRTRARQAGLPFRIRAVPKKNPKTWSPDQPDAKGELFDEFKRLHPRFALTDMVRKCL